MDEELPEHNSQTCQFVLLSQNAPWKIFTWSVTIIIIIIVKK